MYLSEIALDLQDPNLTYKKAKEIAEKMQSGTDKVQEEEEKPAE